MRAGYILSGEGDRPSLWQMCGGVELGDQQDSKHRSSRRCSLEVGETESRRSVRKGPVMVHLKAACSMATMKIQTCFD